MFSTFLKKGLGGGVWVVLLSSVAYAQSGSSSNEGFVRIFRKLNDQNKTENLIFSPYALRSALSMAAVGAKGKTLKQLARSMEALPQSKESPVRLLIANRMWVQSGYSLSKTFLDSSDKNYNVRPWMVDFSKAPDFLK